eukprot:TRINITY_DN12018_c0_g1_i1.p1 TRINITY_DN12018_c0_g1~~TRINITY_DN12018_c0_g1_i1.p1  ORF type:complete len:529 (-),score=107.78 TRINITY_DN12018_c0_g1_i1:228-1814(-)
MQNTTNIREMSLANFFATLFPNKSVEKRNEWIEKLANEEFESVSDLISNDAWTKIGLPLFVMGTLTTEIDKLKAQPVVKQPQTSTYVDTRPITQIDMVVFDISSSMNSRSWDPLNTRLGVAKILFHTMVDKYVGLELPHTLGLTTFGSTVKINPFTRVYETFHDTLGNVPADEGSTRLYDAIYEAAEAIIEFKKINSSLLCNKATDGSDCKLRIFCLTDGDDNASARTYWEVARFLQSNNIIMDAVPLATENKKLFMMASATGGLCLKVNDIQEGTSLFEREAVIGVKNRSYMQEPNFSLPKIENEQSLVQFANKNMVIVDAKQSSSSSSLLQTAPKVSTTVVMKKEDVAKLQQDTDNSSNNSTSQQSVRRILKEFSQISVAANESLYECFIEGQDVFSWKVILKGQPDTPYEHGHWIVNVNFPSDYPFRAPDVRFSTPIYHLNVSPDGKLCIDILRDAWNPAVKMEKVLQTLLDLMKSPDLSSALDTVKANVFTDNAVTYNNNAAAHTKQHCMTPIADLRNLFITNQ